MLEPCPGDGRPATPAPHTSARHPRPGAAATRVVRDRVAEPADSTVALGSRPRYDRGDEHDKSYDALHQREAGVLARVEPASRASSASASSGAPATRTSLTPSSSARKTSFSRQGPAHARCDVRPRAGVHGSPEYLTLNTLGASPSLGRSNTATSGYIDAVAASAGCRTRLPAVRRGPELDVRGVLT